MTPTGTWLASMGAGAGLAYFLDPASGPRRRALARDKVAHTAATTRKALSAAGRDVAHRTYGTVRSLAGRARFEQVEDDRLVERVRAKLGRLVSHPHAIDVLVSDGVVTISGPILRREVPYLLRRVRRVRGVRNVIDSLDAYEEAGDVPPLQGGTEPVGDRLDIRQRNWSPTVRVLGSTAGAALAIVGVRRRDPIGAAAAIVGLGLVARAMTNLPMGRLVANARWAR